MRREVKMHIKYSRTKYILQRTLQAGATILLLTSLLHPGRVLAHLPGVTERVSVDSAGNEGTRRAAFPTSVPMAVSSRLARLPRISSQAETYRATFSSTTGRLAPQRSSV